MHSVCRWCYQITSCHSQEGIFDEFSKAVVEKVNKFKMGGGMDPNTTLGPLISQAAVERVSFVALSCSLVSPALCSILCP